MPNQPSQNTLETHVSHELTPPNEAGASPQELEDAEEADDYAAAPVALVVANKRIGIDTATQGALRAELARMHIKGLKQHRESISHARGAFIRQQSIRQFDPNPRYRATKFFVVIWEATL